VENYAGCELKIVLRLAEEASAHVVAFQAAGKTWIEAIVSASSNHHRECILGIVSSLRLFVSSAHDCVHPKPVEMTPSTPNHSFVK